MSRQNRAVVLAIGLCLLVLLWKLPKDDEGFIRNGQSRFQSGSKVAEFHCRECFCRPLTLLVDNLCHLALFVKGPQEVSLFRHGLLFGILGVSLGFLVTVWLESRSYLSIESLA